MDFQDLVEEINQDRGNDHPDEALQDIFLAHGPEAEDKDRDVQNDDHRADRELEEVIEDNG